MCSNVYVLKSKRLPVRTRTRPSSLTCDAASLARSLARSQNGKKSLTTVQGLPKEFDLKKILKALKKEYCCNGCVVEDEEAGKVLQLQGDQRKNVSTFVVENKLAKKDNIKIHGF